MDRNHKVTKGLASRPKSIVAYEKAAGFILTEFSSMLRSRDKEELEAFLDGAKNISYFSVDIHLNDRIHASVNVDFSREWNNDDHWQIDAESGDVYRCSDEIVVKVNWPGYGSMRASESLPVLAFWQRVAMFAAQLELALAGRYADLFKTKQEEEIEAQARLVQAQQAQAKQVVMHHCKAMRVDKERHVPSIEVDGVPDGTYVVENNNKTFELRISRNIGLAFIVRVK